MPSALDAALEKISGFERPVRLALEIFLAAVCALILARLLWLVAFPGGAVATYTDRPLASPISGPSGAISLSVDRTVLISNNPFASTELEEIVVSAPETSLNLQLDGLRMSDNSSVLGNAIIRAQSGIASNYQVGDEIIAGVTLERILSDRVIINRDGVSETLMLGGRGAGLSVISDDSQIVTAEARASSSEAPAEASLPPINGRAAGPDVLFSAMSVTATRLENGAEGYRLSPRGSVEIMRQAGFEPGDVLLQFNGTSVANIDVDNLFDELESVDTAILRVDRDGTERTIRLELGE
ncbi:MAG: type II secretion system protein N [Henriciella sp.]